ncbi:MAG: hypothetical protein IT479_01225 [Xanthomonadales bacterium]|nr:hypothetical protein [Xanthomonadales bacterium]MCC6591870.1 hypothetical protein [Xanthomonadales bacterium]MCE7931876.1 hypothetical protein [Xanthomonadales bacterium PRO6]
MKRGSLLLLAICLGGAWWHWHTREPSPITRAPGVLAPDPPRQRDLPAGTPLRHGDFDLTPLAEFNVQARLLSRLSYRFDEGAALAPLDFAIGWGRMSDTAVIERLGIQQGARFFTYRWEEQPPIPPDEIVRSATNVHIIPADAGVAGALSRLRAGEVIRLEGLLVEARRADGWHWRSSLSREDSGAGACELLLVQRVARVP